VLGTRAALLASAGLLPVTYAPQALAQTQPAGPPAPQGRIPAAGRVPPAAAARGPAAAPPPRANPANVIQSIKVDGNQRIESGTILSYMLVAPGDQFNADALDRSLKSLYATGLFSDVRLTRQGNVLDVHVAENPIVNRVAFEGNHKLNDDQLRDATQLRPRSVFTPAQADADKRRILDAYAKVGRYDATVEPKIIRLDQNRVDVVFEINEGDTTLVSRIAFVGNHAFSEGRLREVIESRESRFWRIFGTSDYYDPERVNFDKELLRRFYLQNGYADFEVTDATAELAPDRSSFFLTFTLNEGERYKIGKVSVTSKLKGVDPKTLLPLVELEPGDDYNGDAVERSSQAITNALQNAGYAFVDVQPQIARDRAKHIVDMVFDIEQGPRVYVERIDITGNTRTQDKVIRREFQLAEGDAFSADALRKTRQRLQDLGYFNSVQMTPSPGSAPDKTVINANVEEKATGELTVGGGFSTDAGALVNAGLRERNLVGTGIDANLNGVLAQKRSEIDFSLTNPYLFDRNLVGGIDIFHVQNNNQDIAQYSERRTGFALRLGYLYNDHLSQALNYSLVERNIYDIQSGASLYVTNAAGSSLLSQIGQTLSLDYRDSRVDPHSGFIVRVGTDFAGLGGTANFARGNLNGTYYYPLDRYTGNSDWGFAISAGTGYLVPIDHPEQIIDNFFLGGDNLRGFESGGAGPHDIATGESLGGRFIWTQSTELRYPLPISPDLGITGRAFVDVGALSVIKEQYGPVADSGSPRVGAGVGISWRTPFGLINLDLADPVVKQEYDKTQIFRFGFGTRF
jgi:outer membrane protein insertion porin family